MLLRLPLPDFPEGADVRPIAWHAAPGEQLAAGATLVDLLVDLSAGIDQDCPPTSVSRIVLREAAWLVACLAGTDKAVAPGEMLGLLATDAGTLPEAPVGRDVRVTVAAVLHHADWWSG
jgi:hypothetical protein